MIDAVERLLAGAIRICAWLALPLAALLCLQWPLRDLVQAGSRQANDLAQCVFAVFCAVALTAATRERQHLAPHPLWPGARSAGFRRRLERLAIVVALLPWSLWVLSASASTIYRSVAGLEAFPDSYNPGYFIVKASTGLLALLVLLQAIADLAPRSAAAPNCET